MDEQLRQIFEGLPWFKLLRIDAAFEGDWNATVRTVWSRNRDVVDLPDETWGTDRFQPSVELIFDDTWLGIRCTRSVDGLNVLDVERAAAIIDHVLGLRTAP
jgi:hypothetical protein